MDSPTRPEHDAQLPKWIKPCLPTLIDKPPVGAQWVHEIKWDDYRVSAYVADSRATIRTRGGPDLTARFLAVARAAAALGRHRQRGGILDDRGRSSLADLQADLNRHGSDRAVLYAFAGSNHVGGRAAFAIITASCLRERERREG